MQRIHLIAISLVLFSGCYSFKGISIAPDLQTFYIPDITDQTFNAPSNYTIDLRDALVKKIRSESRLTENNSTPDVTLTCVITKYAVTSEATTQETGAAFNRLTIDVKVNYVDAKNENAKWEQQFSRFENFGANENFANVQASLESQINKLLLEDIFNRSFSNW